LNYQIHMEVNMITRSKLLHSLLFVALTSLISGCGGGNSPGTATPAVQSGKLAQGPVKGATVFADRIGGGTRFVQDSDEIWAQTDDNGNYRLPSVPTYNYVLVSKGGKDTLTGLDAIQLLAQPGSANITVLTTLITLDTTKKLYTKLQALQPKTAPIDFDVSTDSTPATLLLVKSVEIAVQSITTAVTSKGFTIPDQQKADVQFQALQQIALGFSATTEKLETPAGLHRALTAAVTTAITEINKASNIKIDSAAAALIADNAVTAATTVLSTTPSSTVALSVSAVQSEVVLASASPAFAAAFAQALNAVSNPTFAQIIIFTATTGATPNPGSPPDIIIVPVNPLPGIITGSAGTGSTGGGTGGGFKPAL
jgi:hypothetical protein